MQHWADWNDLFVEIMMILIMTSRNHDDSDYDLKKSWWFWALPQEIMTWSKMNYPHTVLVKLSPGRRPCKLDCCPSETFDEWIKGLLLWTLSARFLIDVQSREKSSFPSSSYHEIITHCLALSLIITQHKLWNRHLLFGMESNRWSVRFCGGKGGK